MFWLGLSALALVAVIIAAVVFVIYVIVDLLGEFISDMCE